MFMFEKLCRLCVTDKGVSSTLNNSDSDNIILLDKLNQIAPGLLKINSSLPIGICTTCIAQLNQACKFIKNCLRSQEILNKYLKLLQNGLDTEQGENSEIKIIAIKLEENKMINYIKYMNIEQTEVEFPNTLVNYEEESGFIKQENIIEYNDDYESIQVNFEDDIKEAETNVKMEISDEEYNYSINMHSNIDVKEELECLNEDIIDIKNEIIDEHLYETEVKLKSEIKLEDHDSINSLRLSEDEDCEDVSKLIIDLININNEYEFTEVKDIKTDEDDFENDIDFAGFDLIECDLANGYKVKYDLKLQSLAKEINKKHTKNVNKVLDSSAIGDNSSNVNINIQLHNVENVKNVHTALKRSSTRKFSSDIQVNIRSHTNRAPYICNVDKKSRKNQSDITRKICTSKRSYECKICGKDFSCSSKLTTHIRIHTGEKPFHCKTCKKAFVQKGDLMSHNRTHTGEKPYQCKTCKKAFTLKTNLTKHMRIHAGEKSYQCKTCKKAFARKEHLTKHIRTHTGEKPFQCKTCKTAFAVKENLIRHIRTHTGEKPFQCKTCKKSFNDNSNLKAHIRRHTGEKLFQCKVCQKAYNHRSNLTRHVSTHTT